MKHIRICGVQLKLYLEVNAYYQMLIFEIKVLSLNFQFKKLEKEEQSKPKTIRRKERIKKPMKFKTTIETTNDEMKS